MFNSPIRYFGGKGNMLKTLLKYFPPESSYDAYIEPYGGSGVVLFNKPKKEIEVYNDLWELVYNFYLVLKTPVLFEEFVNKITLLPYSEQLRKEYKDKIKTNTFADSIEKALAFYYVNKTSVNGIGGFCTNSVVRRKLPKCVSDYLSSVDRLDEIHQRLSNVIITNRESLKLISGWDRDNTFIYCDPPYEQSTRTSARYSVDADRTHHENLVEILLTIKKSSVLLSGYNNVVYQPLVDKGWRKESFVVKTVDGKRLPKEKTEVLWMNYEATSDKINFN